MADSMTLRGNNQEIIMRTEPQENIPGFIYANSLCRRCDKPVIHAPKPTPVCECEQPANHPVIEPGTKQGQSLVICGAGPSLSRLRSFVSRHKGDVWGCNRALNYLDEWGIGAIGVAIDPSARMFGEVWKEPVETTYYLATSVNPGLVWHLEGKNPIRYWHSLRGAPDELELYGALYPETVLAGNGLNVVNRAVDLAEYMGYDTIYLAGADNALGRDGSMYADGKTLAVDDVVLEGRIGGRVWRTHTDMLMSAVSLVKKQRALKTQTLVFMGDTLPKALQKKPQSFLDRCVEWGKAA